MLEAMVILQVDDSVNIGSAVFSEGEYESSNAFITTFSRRLEEQSTTFNSVELSLHQNGAIRMTHTKKIESLLTPTSEMGSVVRRHSHSTLG